MLIAYILLLITYLNYGTDEENLRIGLWNYYKRDKAVSIIVWETQKFIMNLVK